MSAGWSRFVHQEYDGRARRCTLGLHPGQREDFGDCPDGDFAKTQCCAYTPCQRHKCGPRKGCKCPLPELRAEATP